MVPVGGVLIAIVTLVLNLVLIRPGAPRESIAPIDAPARGALLNRADHPEWRQFLILAATRRADEIDRLRQLPDRPAPAEHAQEVQQVAALPDNRGEADPDDKTGSITENPNALLPLEIGETSSTELPIAIPPDEPPVMRTPERAKPPHQSRKTAPRRVHRMKPPAKTATVPNLFGGLTLNQTPPSIDAH